MRTNYLSEVKLICSKFEYKNELQNNFTLVKTQKATGKQVGVA